MGFGLNGLHLKNVTNCAAKEKKSTKGTVKALIMVEMIVLEHQRKKKPVYWSLAFVIWVIGANGAFVIPMALDVEKGKEQENEKCWILIQIVLLKGAKNFLKKKTATQSIAQVNFSNFKKSQLRLQKPNIQEQTDIGN